MRATGKPYKLNKSVNECRICKVKYYGHGSSLYCIDCRDEMLNSNKGRYKKRQK